MLSYHADYDTVSPLIGAFLTSPALRSPPILGGLSTINFSLEADGSLWFWSQTGLYIKFQNNQGYLERSCVKNKQTKKKPKKPPPPKKFSLENLAGSPIQRDPSRLIISKTVHLLACDETFNHMKSPVETVAMPFPPQMDMRDSGLVLVGKVQGLRWNSCLGLFLETPCCIRYLG